ncbi:PIN domain nuclease [Candidatus Bathyarchaeota archaeon]|nr:MAG: PIN domain nuclease [Candidatus Bathyarchaeota archaeon]
MIVIDASALSKYLLREEGWKSVRHFLVKGVRSVGLVLKEVANAIRKQVHIFRRIDIDRAQVLYGQLKRLVEEGIIVIEDERLYLDKAVEISFKYGITVYDSLYLAQASTYGELLTSDEGQAAIADKLGIKVYHIK